MRKFIFILFLIIVLLAIPTAIGLHYLNTTYLPKVIKTRITQEASAKLNIDVQIEDIKFNIFKGIIFHKVNIKSKDNPDAQLQIERASATFLILPFFSQKKVIFPSVNIYSPKIDLIRYQDNKFNFQDLMPKQMGQDKAPLAYSILIYRVDIFDSEINFLDQTIEPSISRTLKLDSLGTQIYPWGVNFNLRGSLVDNTQTSSLSLSGNYNLEKKELKVSSQLNKLDLLSYLAYFNIPMSIKSLLLDNINSECVLTENSLKITNKADITDAHLVTGAYLVKDKTLITDATAKLQADVILDIKNTADLSYFIHLDDVKANLITPQIPEKVKIEYAKFEISPDKAIIKNSKISALQTKLSIKGEISNFKNPAYNIRLQADIDLSTAKDFLRIHFEAINPIILEGKADIDISALKSQDDDIKFKGSIDFKNAAVKTIDSPFELNELNGVVNFEEQKIEWSNLSFKLFDKFFYSKAVILDLPLPLINLELYNDKINIHTKLRARQKNLYDIEYLKGNFHNSKFEISGDLNIKDKTHYDIDLDLEGLIDLEDLKQIEIIPQEQLSKINARGICSIDGRIQGNAKYPTLLTSQVNLNTNELSVYNYKVNNVDIKLAQENQQIKIPSSQCDFYGGTLSINGLIDLEKETFPYALKVFGENIELSKIKRDIPIDDKLLKGSLSSTIILSGQMDSIQDLKAQGEFLIQDGYLWNFNPLKELGDFLFIPRYESLVFKEATGNFNITNNKISLTDVVLSSNVLLLTCEGTIDFKGNLDLDITPKAISDITENLDEYEKFFAGIFSEAGGVVSVKITGTVRDPKFKKKIILMQVLDKAKDEVIDKIKAFTDLIFGGTPQENP